MTRDAKMTAEDACEWIRAHGGDAGAIISALTAPPEKPRVDVRKVLQCWEATDRYGPPRPTFGMIEGALLRAGYEVVE